MMVDVSGKVPQIEGSFTALSLISLIQSISNNKKMLIKLFAKDGGEGVLFFDSAKIVGARADGNLTGKKAFFRMIEWEDARFTAYDIEEINPKYFTINLDASELLLEGLRQKDEKKKIKERILPIYKVRRANSHADLDPEEHELYELIPPRGTFVSTVINRCSQTDWEGFKNLESLMMKKALSFMRIKTLVVDDSEFMTKILKDILEELYEGLMVIRTLKSGEEAVRIIRSSDQNLLPDLIFTDIMMEGVTGMDVIQAAREKKSPIHTIAVTSLQREMTDILGAGANYLHKNWITKDNIGEVIKDLVERTIAGELFVIGGEGDFERTVS
jgi:CheY-like chemotaxis protein